MLLTENPGESPEFVFVGSMFTWDWILALSFLAALAALAYLLLGQSLEAAKQLLSEIQGPILLPVLRLVGSFQTVLVEECTIQIQARKAKAKSYLIFTAIKVHMKRIVVILFHLSHTVCTGPGKKGQCWFIVNNTKIEMLCVTEHTEKLFYGRLETKHLLYLQPVGYAIQNSLQIRMLV